MSLDFDREWIDEVCYIAPAGTFDFTGPTVTENNGNMAQASGAVAPSSAPFRIENTGAVPILLQSFRIRYGANGYTGSGAVTILGEQFTQNGPQFDVNGVYATVEFTPVNGVGVEFPVGGSHNSLGGSNHGALTGGFQGPVITNNPGGLFPAGNISRAELDYVVGVEQTQEVTVRSYVDGELAVVDKVAKTITPLASIPLDWVECPPDEVAPVLDDAIEVRLSGAFELPTAVDGEVHHFSVEALPVSITSLPGEPISAPDFSALLVGDQLTALPQGVNELQVTGAPITLSQPNSAPNSVSAVLIPGVVEFSRGNGGGLLNTISQGGNNGGAVIVDDVEWFYDPGNTFLPIPPTSLTDTTTPTTNSMSDAFDNAIGDEILGTNSWIRIISTGQIFELNFTNWQQGGGGGFTFTASEMTEVPVLGWNVRKTSGVHTVTGTAVDNTDPLNPVIDLVPEKHVLSSFTNLGTSAERVLVDGVPFLCMEDAGPTFVSYNSGDVITPRDVSAPVYVDFTVKRATVAQPDSSFTHLSNFSALFQTFVFNVQTGAVSVNSGGTSPDPVIELVDIGQDEIRFVVQFDQLPGSFAESWRFRPAGDALSGDAGIVYVKDGAFEVTTENPVVSAAGSLMPVLTQVYNSSLQTGINHDTNDANRLYTWANALNTADLDHNQALGRFEAQRRVTVQIAAAIIVLNATANDRAAFYSRLVIRDAGGTNINDIPLSTSTYIRDDLLLYDKGAQAGSISITLEAGQTFEIRTTRLSSQDPNDDNPADAAQSVLRIWTWGLA